MCGIAGILCPSGADWTVLRPRLQAAVRVQHHRGPDAGDVSAQGKVGLAHNRLSILDLSEAGQQPMVSHSGRLAIVYNGETYNFQEIARDLDLTLRSGSDTEVILEAFEKIGPELFGRLSGMFAFALHDRAANCVWLVRDRLGIKPLYLAADGTDVLFASEIKGLFALSDRLQPRLREDALHEWAYYGNALGPRTLYQGITQLEPGHALRLDLETGVQTQTCYWSIQGALAESTPDPRVDDPVEAARQTREILDQSVRRHLVSDVPVGIFLSGGIDSSAIACLASRHVSQPLTSYSAAFDHDTDTSELALAADVARAAGTDHHEVRIHGGDTADVVSRMIEAHDLPFSDAANIPLYMLCDKVGADHKVILQGDAGDEMFAGYQRHLTLMQRQGQRGVFRAARGLAGLPLPGRRYQRIARMVAALGAPSDAETMALLLTVERRAADPTRIFGADLRARIRTDDPFVRYRDWDSRFPGRSLAEKMLLVDKAIILPDIFFQKVDRSTMAASVEVRVPFADNAVVDHVLGLSPQILMTGGRQKGLLRQAMQGVIPDNVLAGRKRGFGVPFEKWVTGPLLTRMQDALATVDHSHPGLLDRARVQAMIDEHMSRRRDHGFLLWKTFNLCLWLSLRKVVL